MDHEMIERCCLALEQNFRNRIATQAGMTFSETGVSLPNREVWYSYAETVIKAMREPTEKMKSIEGVHWNYGCYVCGGLTEGWYAMIDSITSDNLCKDEGCPNSKIDHICINKND